MKWFLLIIIFLAGCQADIEETLITEDNCRTLEPVMVDPCLVRAAYESGDKSLCIMDDQFYKDRCLLGVAEKTGDISICEEIVGDDKERCLTSFSDAR